MRRDLGHSQKARFVIAVMWQPTEITFSSTSDFQNLLLPLLSKLSQTIGGQSEIFEFKSAYYQPEMGPELKKCFIEISGLVSRDCLVSFKQQAYDIETASMKDGKRIVNLDPMIVCVENMVIATSKGFSHRIYLGQGVYGDLALICRNKKFEPLPWTYADYQEHLSYFEEIRKKLKQELFSNVG
jgi:hypothetical protein